MDWFITDINVAIISKRDTRFRFKLDIDRMKTSSSCNNQTQFFLFWGHSVYIEYECKQSFFNSGELSRVFIFVPFGRRLRVTENGNI